MTLTEILKFLWDGVDIPVTKDEIQHTVNVATWTLKKGLSEDEDFKELNNLYKNQHGIESRKHLNMNVIY